MSQKISIGKSFFTKELSGYSNWRWAFVRELIQNSLDAGSTRLDFSFQAIQTEDNRTTYRFILHDNGCGMDATVLKDVYFCLGETTKQSDQTVGGFGRARILTCFAHERYRIDTQDQRVEGTGGEYRHEQQQNWVSGCRVEVDLDREFTGYYDETGRFREHVQSFFERSELKKLTVTWNGEPLAWESKHVMPRSEKNRIIVYDRDQSPIGVLGFTKKPKTLKDKNESGFMLIRSHGVLMFESNYRVPYGYHCILELEPSRARSLLTSNRDGLRCDYESGNPEGALVDLFSKIQSEDVTFLQKKAGYRNDFLTGQLGLLNIQPQSGIKTTSGTWDIPMSEQIQIIKKFVEKHAPSYDDAWCDHRIESLAKSLAHDILNDVLWSGAPDWLVTWAHGINDNQSLKQLVDALQTEQQNLLMNLVKKYAHYQHQLSLSSHQSFMHHHYCTVQDETPKLKTAIRSWHPNYWDLAQGKGIRSALLMRAWQEACSIMIEQGCLLGKLSRHDESVGIDLLKQVKNCPVITGFHFQGEDQDEMIAGALCTTLNHEDKQYTGLLLNPVEFDVQTKTWKSAYNFTTDPLAFQKLLLTAAHEVSHILYRQHNQSHSYMMGGLLACIDLGSTGKPTQRIRNSMANMKQSIQFLRNQVEIRDSAHQDYMNECHVVKNANIQERSKPKVHYG